METTSFTQLTDSLKAAHCELSINLTEKETLLKLARKLDSVQRDLDFCRTFIETERAELKEFKDNFNHILVPKKRVGFSNIKSSRDDVKTSAYPAANICDDFCTLEHLSKEEFDSIPKYSRGRLAITKINSLLDHLNRLLVEKYTLLLRTNPAKLSIDQRQRIAEWRAAESPETFNKFFLTEADLKVKSAAGGAFKFDQVARNVLTILRVVGRIKESRNPGIIRYIFQ